MHKPWKPWIGLSILGAVVGCAIVASGRRLGRRDLAKLESRVRDFASALDTWNLKYDRFPDVDAWLDKHWTAPYGRDQARNYLSQIMSRRADAYWGVQRSRHDDDRCSFARKSYANVLADLRGDTYANEVEAAKHKRSICGGAATIQVSDEERAGRWGPRHR